MEPLAVIPDPYRSLAVALLAAIAVAQVIASQIVAQLPQRVLDGPGSAFWRALHFFGHARFRDEPGTVKPPFSPVSHALPEPDAIERAYDVWRALFSPGAPPWREVDHQTRTGWAWVASAASGSSLAHVGGPPEVGGGTSSGRPTVAPPEPELEPPGAPPGAVRRLLSFAARDAPLAGLVGGIALAFVHCGGGPVRDLVPGAPPRVGCQANAQRCGAGVPEVCSPEGAWWPALGRAPDGRVLACPDGSACEVDDAGAVCAPARDAAEAEVPGE